MLEERLRKERWLEEGSCGCPSESAWHARENNKEVLGARCRYQVSIAVEMLQNKQPRNLSGIRLIVNMYVFS